jgi:hypothetical protein
LISAEFGYPVGRPDCAHENGNDHDRGGDLEEEFFDRAWIGATAFLAELESRLSGSALLAF